MADVAYKTAGCPALGDHVCFPFCTEEEQRVVMTAYILEGLQRGEAVRYFAYDTCPERVPEWLREAGTDPSPYQASGQLAVVPLMAALGPEGRVDLPRAFATIRSEVASALDQGFTGLRLTSEMSWAADRVPGGELAVDFEMGVTAEFGGRRVLALCQYDRRRFSCEQFATMEGMHPQELAPEGFEEEPLLQVSRLSSDCGMRLTGEVDLSAHALLADVLASAARESKDAGGDLVVDLSGLRYADVTGVSLIVETARALPEGGNLVLVSPTRTVRTMLGLLHWDRLPEVRIVDAWEA